MKDIKTLLKENMDELRPLIEKFPWEDKLAYGHWLTQTYNFVKHSTHLLALASARCQPGDKYHRHFAHHLGEESGHENLLVNDMKFLDFNPKTMSREFASSSAMYQGQYYWIEHRHPLAFFGYMLMLEASAVEFGPQIYERVKAAHSAKCAGFLKVHSAEDIDHVESDFEELAKIPPEALDFAIQSMQQSFAHYKVILAECQAHVNKATYKKAS